MPGEVLLSVPTELAEQIIAQANLSGRSVADTIRSALKTDRQQPVTTMEEWPNIAVLAAANLEMPPAQDARHSELLQLRKSRQLAPSEQAELMNLHEVYTAGNLHKARGMAEAYRRGLRDTLSS